MLTGHVGHRPIRAGDCSAQVITQPGGQPGPKRHLIDPLDERPALTSRLGADQSTLAPPQQHPLPTSRKVLDPAQWPVLDPQGDHPAVRASSLTGFGLDNDPDGGVLTGDIRHLEDHETV